MKRGNAGESILPDVVTITLVLVHAAVYGLWIIDDAGITFAYARSAVEGLGYVAQAGDAPVEGFTNALWLWALTIPLALDIFDPAITPKLLGVAMAAAALVLVRRAAVARVHAEIGDEAPHAWITGAAWLTALNPGLVIWSASGLENGLTALLAAALLDQLVRPRPRRHAWVSGFLVGLMFANRPDGATFIGIFPLAAAWSTRLGRGTVAAAAAKEGPGDRWRKPALTASITAATVMAAVTLWRWVTFGDVVPNTFHAKGGDTLTHASRSAAFVVLAAIWCSIGLPRRDSGPGNLSTRSLLTALTFGAVLLALLHGLNTHRAAQSLASPIGPTALAVTMAIVVRSGSLRSMHEAWVFVGLALFQSCALPPDWMPEFRFATPLITIGLVTMAATLTIAAHKLDLYGSVGIRVALATVTIVIATKAGLRAFEFRAAPTVPLAECQAGFEDQFVPILRALETPETPMESMSILLPDIGGPYWSRSVTVYDLCGLCDREVALRLPSPPALAAWILDSMQPTCIATHSNHTKNSGLLDHPGLDQNYVQLDLPGVVLVHRGTLMRAALTAGTLLDRVRETRLK